MPTKTPTSAPMSPAQAAQLKNVSRRTIMRAIESHELQALRDNRNHWKIDPQALDKWADAQWAPTGHAHYEMPILHTPDLEVSLARVEAERDALREQLEQGKGKIEITGGSWRRGSTVRWNIRVCLAVFFGGGDNKRTDFFAYVPFKRVDPPPPHGTYKLSIILSLNGLLMVRFICVFAFSAIALTSASQAQERIQEQDGLGIKLEELISEKGTFRLEFGTTLRASRRDGVSGLFQTIQTGTGEFVTIPIAVGATDRQAETVLSTVGLRYGLTTRSEIYSRATLRYSHSRATDSITGLTQSHSNGSFQSLVVGMNYRFLDEGERPGLIGFADVSVAENTSARGTDLQFGKSGTIGFTAYRVLDPVVLSVTSGYRANLSRTVDGDRINPGDTLFINPSVGFAVNNELTLTGGLGLSFTGADKLNGVTQGTRNTDADLQFGLAYAWDRNTTLRADARAEALGDRNVTVGLTLTRTFGRN